MTNSNFKSIDLDFIDLSAAPEFAAKYDLTFTVIDENGPAQCPLIQFVGPIDNLKNMIAEYSIGGESPEFYHDLIK